MKTFFISGTGTGVGKTIVSCGLAKVFADAGLKTSYMKPIRTGAEMDDDPGFVYNQVSNLYKLPDELICQYAFSYPASPHFAARLEKKAIAPSKILDAYEEIKKSVNPDILIIEGAGGVYVPIVGNYTFMDLVKALDVPVIITAPAYLGAINHTMLTVDILKNKGIRTAGIIFNKLPENPGLIETDNINTIETMSGLPVLSVIKELSPLSKLEINADSGTRPAIAELIASQFDKNKILLL